MKGDMIKVLCPETDLTSNRILYASFAMSAIIAKLPLFDRDGERGPKPEEGMDKVRADVAESAFDYAEAMCEEERRRRDDAE